jgi:glycosyl transferase family 25
MVLPATTTEIKEKSKWQINSIPAFCITLERRTDRWKRFQDQPGIQGLQVKRFVGVDGKTLDIKTDPRVATLTKRNILTKSRRAHEELDSAGGVGCALSHIAIWQWMVDNNQNVCLVFEDDAVIPPNFIEKTNTCIETSFLKDPAKWDLWLLGGKWSDVSHIPGEKIVRIEAFVLFHSYIITLNTAKQLLQNVYPIHAHIDTWVSIHGYITQLRIVGDPTIKLQQYQAATTDIQSKKECAICNVSTHYEDDFVMVSKSDLYIARASEIVCIVLIGYFIWKKCY